MTTLTNRPGVQAPAGDTRGESSPFLTDLQQAFTGRPRMISPKYFYDAEGSRLFERICELPEYYPTRTELGILRRHAAQMAHEIESGSHAPPIEIIEFGAGSCDKVRLLLDAFDRPLRFRPIDISADHLAQSAAELERDYPQVDVRPLAADYTQHLPLPDAEPGTRRIGFFPGSTIGNFSPDEAVQFLRMAARALRGGGLLLGADLVKDPAVLHAAYNDAAGVTAAFNLNLMARANRELGTQFDLQAWTHHAFYNAPVQRIEMHLIARRAQEIRIAGQRFDIEEGETLHTENSHKFTPAAVHALAQRAGFTVRRSWTDERRWFGVFWLLAPPAGVPGRRASS